MFSFLYQIIIIPITTLLAWKTSAGSKAVVWQPSWMASGKEEPWNSGNLKNETGNKLLSEPLGKPYNVSELFIPYTKYEWSRKNRPCVHFAQEKFNVLRKRKRSRKQLLDSDDDWNRKDSYPEPWRLPPLCFWACSLLRNNSRLGKTPPLEHWNYAVPASRQGELYVTACLQFTSITKRLENWVFCDIITISMLTQKMHAVKFARLQGYFV